jgi:hypothetical protein
MKLTANPNQRLNAFARDVTSQSGEDGILEKILETIPEPTGWCVEFGAWDGRHRSNTCHLVEASGYAAVLIEGNADRFRELQQHCARFPKAVPLHAMVGYEAGDGLDALLAGTAIPEEFDVLSIDIDGNDYHVWDATRRYRPRVVVIEFNPTIPTPVDFVQARDTAVNQGCSLKALDRLARSKGYCLVATTKLNALFVQERYFPAFGIADNSIEALRVDDSAVTYLFNGYDGTVFVRGLGELGWHRLPYRESRLQQLPRWLRQYPDHYPRWKRTIARLYRSLRKRGVL